MDVGESAGGRMEPPPAGRAFGAPEGGAANRRASAEGADRPDAPAREGARAALLRHVLLVPGPAALLSGEARRLRCNPAFADLIGRPLEEVQDRPLLEVWPDAAPLLSCLDAALAGSPGRHEAVRTRRPGRTGGARGEAGADGGGADGEGEEAELEIEGVCTPAHDGGEAPFGVVWTLEDVAGRRGPERRRAFIAELGARIGALSEPGEILDRASEALGRALEVDRVAYATLAPRSARARVVGEWAPGGAPWRGAVVDLAEFAGHADLALGGREIAVADVAALPAAGTPRERLSALGLRAYLVAPLVKGGRLDGVLFALSSAPRRWTAEEKALIAETAERTWSAAERARAEARLRASEEHLRHVLDLNPQIPWTCDPDGEVTSYTARWLELTGQTPGEPLGQGWREAVLAEDLERTLAVLAESLASGRPLDVEFRVRTPERRPRWVRARASPLRTEGGEILRWYGLIEDVDDRRLAEERVRESERRLAAVVERAPVGILLADAPSGRLVLANSRLGELFGREIIQGAEAGDYAGLHGRRPDGTPVTARDLPLARTLRTGETVHGQEIVFASPDGRERALSVSSAPVPRADGGIAGAVVVFEDVTPRRRAEAELRRLNEDLEAAVAERTAERDRMWLHSLDLLAVVGRDGVLRRANPAWRRVLGLDPDEVEGRAFLDFVEPGDRARAGAAVAGADPGAEPAPLELALLGSEGRVRRIAWSVALTGSELFAVGRDVTEERRREAELSRTHEALLQAQKMEAVGQLTGGIAHDFNNVLAAVMGGLDLIRRRPDDPDRVRTLGGQALEAAERGAKLTAQLLAFSRSQRLELRALALEPLLAEIRPLLAATLGPLVELQIAQQGRDEAVLADRIQLEMALLNLSINARDAMPEGGRLQISTRRLDAAELEAAAPELGAGAFVQIEVADEGCGMPAEVLERALEPFFTTKGVGKGTGLGLSQVYGFARQAGGAVRIESRPGEGARVRLILPAADPPPAEAAGWAAPSARAGGAARILVVDDDQAVRRAFVDALRALGYEVEDAASGPEGLERLARSPPDLVLIDYAMPGMTGAEAARRARAAGFRRPILFASGFADAPDITRAAGAEARILRKPFRIEDLGEAVASALAADARARGPTGAAGPDPPPTP